MTHRPYVKGVIGMSDAARDASKGRLVTGLDYKQHWVDQVPVSDGSALLRSDSGDWVYEGTPLRSVTYKSDLPKVTKVKKRRK